MPGVCCVISTWVYIIVFHLSPFFRLREEGVLCLFEVKKATHLTHFDMAQPLEGGCAFNDG